MKRILRRMFSFIHRLQWKLTLSYTLVTVLVLTILMVIAIFATNFFVYSHPRFTLMMAEALNSAAAELAPALQAAPPDMDAITDWVSQVYQGNTLTVEAKDHELDFSFSTMVATSSILAVLDPQGRVLVSNHPESLPAGDLISTEIPPFGQELVARALTGEMQLSRLFTQAEFQQLAVTPIRADDGALLGMVFLLMQRPSYLQIMWFSLMSTLPVIGFVSVFAGLVGSVFGALTARGLANRLNKATQATKTWGQGDFSARITDRQQDEIGLLAQDLNHMADQLEELMRTQQKLATLEERNRIARDLHDSAKQQVFATSMNLAAARTLWDSNPDEARKRLDIALEISRQSQQELTTLIQTLRPVQLNQHNLTSALEQAVHTWQNQTGIPVSSAVAEESVQMTTEGEQALFRVAQEALANIARHSAATQVAFSLRHENGFTILQLKDNGHGFDPNQPVRGLGLRSMHERITAVGGKLEITSSVTGTCLTARVPAAG